ncbi:MAG: sulfatase-like hydrolase/transferase, partial [Xanthomonadaceae bacterium]|nr:sulfatase-like hydrolase/transferase [Xanthomonadaceae bacterium]
PHAEPVADRLGTPQTRLAPGQTVDRTTRRATVAAGGAGVKRCGETSGADGAEPIGNIAFSTANGTRIALTTATQMAEDRTAVAAESATQSLRHQVSMGNQPAGRVFLIVVESLGIWRDRELDALQLGPILELGNEREWSVRTGSVPFAGSTVPAELRELCAIRLLTVQPSSKEIPSERCLPAEMNRMGYETLVAHGFLGATFGRRSWYPSLGFDGIWFAPEILRRAKSPKRCGIAFNGLCDDVVWDVLVSHVVSRPEARHFVYWLTLSAHLPVEYRNGQETSDLCNAHASTRDNEALCGLLLWHRALFENIADTLKTQLSDDVQVIVVGDHSPPFLERSSRELFEQSRVPFVEIRSVAD